MLNFLEDIEYFVRGLCKILIEFLNTLLQFIDVNVLNNLLIIGIKVAGILACIKLIYILL